MSQESLAGLAHIDRSYMSSVERGLRNVSILNIARIAEALNVPVRDLIGPRQARPALEPRRIGPVRSLEFPSPVLTPDTPLIGGPPALDEVALEWEPGRYLSLG